MAIQKHVCKSKCNHHSNLWKRRDYHRSEMSDKEAIRVILEITPVTVFASMTGTLPHYASI